MNEVIYITSWYFEKNDTRRAELEFCITNVLANKAIDKVILIEDGQEATYPDIFHQYSNERKLFFVEFENRERPTFKDFFEIANEYAKENDVVIIANTDIYPEYGSVEKLLNIKSNECYALARYDKLIDNSTVLLDRWDAQDCWVFCAPIRNVQNCDFELGRAGSDNAIAHRLRYAGYAISNPSKSIQFNHFHLSQVHNYNPDHKIDKPYLLITPHELGVEPSLHEC